MFQPGSPKTFITVPSPISPSRKDDLPIEASPPREARDERTLLDLRRLKCISLTVACRAVGCGHFGNVKFERLGLSSQTRFYEIDASTGFRCEACKGKMVGISPAFPPAVARSQYSGAAWR